MNRRILVLPLGMAAAGAAWGQARTADVLYASHSATPVHASRLGDECFVPIEATKDWDWKVERDGDAARVRAEEQSVTVPVRTVGGTACLALRKAVEMLGGGSEWVATTDALQVWSPLASLSVKDGKVSARAALGVRAYGSSLAAPDRAVIDIDGARLDRRTRLDLPVNARVSQFRPNVVRLVVELPYVPLAPGVEGVAGRAIDLNLDPADLPKTVAVDEPQEKPSGEPLDPRVPRYPTPDGPVAPASLAVDVLPESSGRTVVQIPLTGRITGPATFDKSDPLTLTITLPGVQGFLPDGFVSPVPAVLGAEARLQGRDTVLTLHLARPAGAEVATSPDGVTITLGRAVVGGKLAGKVVIVDAGHGGHDSGATGGGAMEKLLTLKIARLLTDELTKAGATVIMTRKTDVFIPLQTRSDISNRNHADLFLSVHINSTGGSATSQSGTITFHHKGDETGRQLAACIQAEIAKVNGLPNKGVWSDGRIYQSGFAVLRNTYQKAAVLIEMGFINNPRDRTRMLTDDFQTKVAAAVVRGVKVYLGDSSQ